MGDWNTENAKHKAARRQPAPDAKLPAKRKKRNKAALRFEVWYRWNAAVKRYELVGGVLVERPPPKDWRVGRYATREEAQAYIDKQSRGAYVSGLHYPAGTPIPEGELLAKQAAHRERYYIKEVT